MSTLKASLLSKKVGIITVKVTKTQALMLILKTLFEQGFVTKENIMNMIDVSDLTFRKYMQEVRAFFLNFNIPYELKYSRSEQKYYLFK